MKSQVIKDGKFIEQGCDIYKVLVPKYNPSQDNIQVASSSINENTQTVLSWLPSEGIKTKNQIVKNLLKI